MHLAFGVGVITPRWLYVLAAATPEQYGDPLITDETLDPWDPDDRLGWRRRRHRHPYRQRGAGLRDRQGRPRARARTSSTAAFTRRSIPKRPTTLGGAHAVVKGDGDLVWAQRARGLRAQRAAADVRRRQGRRRRLQAGALGADPARQVHVGVGADRARLPEALLVLLGVADRRPAAAPADGRRGRSARSWSCAGAGSGSSRSPTTISIP